MSVWPCKECGKLVHIDYAMVSGMRCPECATKPIDPKESK